MSKENSCGESQEGQGYSVSGRVPSKTNKVDNYNRIIDTSNKDFLPPTPDERLRCEVELEHSNCKDDEVDGRFVHVGVNL